MATTTTTPASTGSDTSDKFLAQIKAEGVENRMLQHEMGKESNTSLRAMKAVEYSNQLVTKAVSSTNVR